MSPQPAFAKPPGGDSYTEPNPEPGAVRSSAPASNPPQKTLEAQSKALKRQQERQQQLASGGRAPFAASAE